MDLALELTKAQAPVVAFIDEIDQAIQSRDQMWDNTGVNNRLLARLFEFMSDTNLRGRVLWIAASNRPELLDLALRREGRFDEKIPFLPPSAQERAEILPAILRKLKVLAERQRIELKWNISDEFFEEFGWRTHWHISGEVIRRCDPDLHPFGKEDNDEFPFTGAQIETLAERACKLAAQRGETLSEKHLLEELENYSPGPDFREYQKMTDAALLYCTSLKFIPDGKWKRRAEALRSQDVSGQSETRIRVR